MKKKEVSKLGKQALLVDISTVGAVFGIQAAAVASGHSWQIGARGRGIIGILRHGVTGCDQRVARTVARSSAGIPRVVAHRARVDRVVA